jgi:hypothetical protein
MLEILFKELSKKQTRNINHIGEKLSDISKATWIQPISPLKIGELELLWYDTAYCCLNPRGWKILYQMVEGRIFCMEEAVSIQIMMAQ